MNLWKKMLIFSLTVFCICVTSITTVNAENSVEGDAPDVRTLTSAMESTYDKDAYVSVNLFVQPDWRGANDYGIGLDFTADGQPLSSFTMRDELLYWATHGKEAGTQKDNPTHVAKDNFRIPAANWDFSIEVGSQLPDDSVEAFCYQSKVNIEKGKVYTIYAIYGSKDWVEQNKNTIIPSNYVTMGESLLADTTEQDNTAASTVNPTVRGIPTDKNGILIPSFFSDETKLQEYLNTTLKDADLVYYEYGTDTSHKYTLTGAVYKHYYKLSQKDKAGFDTYLKKHTPPKGSSTIDAILQEYCNSHHIALGNTISKSTKHNSNKNVLPSADKTKKSPVKGIIIVIILVVLTIVGLIRRKKYK